MFEIPDTYFTVQEQTTLFLFACLLGLPMGLLFDLFRMLRVLFRHAMMVPSKTFFSAAPVRLRSLHSLPLPVGANFASSIQSVCSLAACSGGSRLAIPC